MTKTDKNISGFIKITDKGLETLKKYEKFLTSKEIIELNFSMADAAGNLYYYENGIRIQLDNVDVFGEIYEPRHRAAALSNKYPVIVTSIDYEKNIVHVSHKAAKKITKEELMAEIEEGIKNGEPITVVSRVVAIKGERGRSYCIIDIGGVGITGVIKLGEWSKTFTDDFRYVTKRGDVCKVVVKRKGKWNGAPAYHCSRKDALEEDPWEGIEEKLPKNTIVNVKCLSKTEKNFFGRIEGIDEISAFCEYPDESKNIRIIEGFSYQGYVYKVSEKDRMLRVRIFKQLNQ